MKIKWFLPAVCACFLVSCSHGLLVHKMEYNHKSRTALSEKQEVPAAFFPDPIQIVSVGDSLTEGVGDSTDRGGYLPYLKGSLEKEPGITSVEIKNYGRKGNRSDQLLKRLDDPSVKDSVEQADAVMITIGGNDIMKVVKNHFADLQVSQFNEARAAYEKRLNQILKKIRLYNPETQIYLVGIYNPFSKWFTGLSELDTITRDWNDGSKKIVSRYHSAYFIGIGDIFTDTSADLLYQEDYFHPNDLGYKKIAERIYSSIEIDSLGSGTLTVSAEGDE